MEIQEKILAYLSVHGKENRYKLARALKIDVSKIIKALSELEEEGKIEIKTGRAMLVKGKKPIITKAKKRKKRPRVAIEEEKEEEMPLEEEKPEEELKEEEPKEEPEEEKPEEEEVPKEEEEAEPEEEGKEEVPEELREEGIEEEMVKGTVKFFNPNKGFGFITGDDGKEYYVHESGLKEGVTIKVDDRVSFKVVQGEKGPKAEDVEKVEE